ncbi:MAG TPA: ribonuclease R [Woeseiaceae bacterium]|nr:ribonuclease R [Woeseiaceae bacterium]
MPKRKARKRPASKKKPYEHPIPSRSELIDFLEKAGRPLKVKQIIEEFGLKGERMRTLLEERLETMHRAGQIIENRRREYCLTAKLDLVTGTVSGHPDGFGFVARDDGDGDDVYLSAREMRALFHGDRVVIRVVGQDRRGKPEGKLVEVLERAAREVAGQFIRERGIGLVIPDNPKIAHRVLIAQGETGKAKHGEMVVAEILDYPTHFEQATGRIVRVIGAPDQKGIATDIAIHSNGIPTEWPGAVRKQVTQFGSTVPTAAKKGRVDLRETDLVTIDGADARDFDDAVYCERSGEGWRLLVAIADVAHYVDVDSPLDQQATARGTSVYFPDRVVPMLPEELSNGLCSLNPKVDRLCLVCDMRIGRTGKVSSAKFVEGVMRSKARLTYDEVNDFLTGKSADAVPRGLHRRLRDLQDLYKAFALNRSRRGAIELDLPMTKFELNEGGEIARIVTAPRNDAHRLIEECMIAANVQAAKFLRKHRIASLYRVHARPDPERFDELRQYLVSLGLKVPHSEHVEPMQFNKLLEQVAGRADSAAISMAMLRSLTHAEYTPNNIGHFGLALDAYAHFTSPIRRYPDLLVHRAIRHVIRGGKPGAFPYDKGRMERLGAITSAHERRAEDATREVEAWLKCQYMLDRVGEDYPGVITGVTNFGLFVQIPELQIDGLVHVTSLESDYFKFDAGRQQLVGERSGTRYSLGEPMRVQVQRVDMDTRRIDFRPLRDETGPERSGRRR